MKYDPAIEAVRDVRRRISATVGHDPQKLVEYYQRLQQRHRTRMFSPTAEGATQESASRAV